MFCPSCRDEFRSGFTRCEACGVDLVEDLSSPPSAKSDKMAPRDGAPATGMPRLVDYCGFVGLDEARAARDRLRAEGVRAEIAIREAPGADLARAAEEEFWLRVDSAALPQAMQLLGYDTQEAAAEEGDFDCSDCGNSVAEGETFCSRCGARFEGA